VAPLRRFHSFNDDLRARFGDRVQRVTLGGALVCPDPRGMEECDFCRDAARVDPDYGQGFPVHEQIRRGINFSRRKGTQDPLLLVTVQNPRGTCMPADHLKATMEAVAAQEHVAVIAVSMPAACVTPEVMEALAGKASENREIWLEFESLPEEWPVGRDPNVRFGVPVRIDDGRPVDLVAEHLKRLSPDAVGFVPELILEGTPEAERYENGKLDEPELDTFARRVAEILERIPGTIAIHPLVLTGRSDQIVGPRWALNRQRAQQAIGDTLEKAGTSQGATSGRASSEA
jgi:uncharacterized protein